jgi:protein gp37
MAKRLQAMGQPNYANGFKLTLQEKVLELPLMWKKPQSIFVNSMSDLFHKNVPAKFIQKVFHIMEQAHWHRFQILTKRSERLLELNPKLSWSSNVWMGVSVENQEYTFRIDHLRKSEAKIKFISFEPLLGPVCDLNLKGIDWVIVGGESGPQARPMDASWAVDIRNQCQRAETPFFFKQWGGPSRKKAGRKLEGRTWDEIPEAFDMIRAVSNY